MKMNLDDLRKHVIYELEDDGDWGYTREGIGRYEGRTFLVDLDDSGEEERELLFVKEGMQIDQVLAIGKQTRRYNQCPSGTFFYSWDDDGDQEVVAKFKALVGI